MSRTRDIKHAQVLLLDHAIQMRVNKVKTRRRTLMPEQARLHVFERQRLAQQRIGEQIDLPDG